MLRNFTLLILLILPTSLAHAQLPIRQGAQLKLVGDGYKFTEGPAVDPNGDVYFTDQPNNRILKWTSANNKIENFLQPCGRANGLYFDHEGKLISCADENGQLQQIDPTTKAVTVLINNYNHKLLNGPNDLWVAPNGGIFFTDPFYKRDYWKSREAPGQVKECVYYLPKGAKNAVIVEDSLIRPNGIIGTPDGKHLYVADIDGNKTFRYNITKTGKITHRELFCEMGSDGMTLDSEGNLYLTGKGVTVFNKTGKKIGEIPINKSWTANICFGGSNMKTLFITASDSVYTLDMAVAGTK
jgi:gluconolactonase